MELVVSVILCTAPRPCGFREGWDCEAWGRDAGRCKWLCLSEQSWCRFNTRSQDVVFSWKLLKLV